MRPRPLLVLSLLFAAGAAQADINFEGQITGPVETRIDADTGFTRIHFHVDVKNTGSSAFKGHVKLKGFLLPLGVQAEPRSDQHDGIVLKTLDLPLEIGSGKSTTAHYLTVLPKIPSGEYALAVFVNSDNSVRETSTVDNVTQPVRTGPLSVTQAPAEKADFDLYAEVDGEIEFRNGGASHRLRTILRGDYRQFPSTQHPSEKLWARFMMVDLEQMKIHTLPYDETTIDKNWFAVSYATERDSQGREIFVDYYSQAPLTAGIPAGKYTFLTLLNSRDQLPESDRSNNLDAQVIDFPGN